MSSLGVKFDRDVMIELFHRVGEICKERQIVAEIAVYGGSAVMIQPTLFPIRRITEDIDYVPIMANGEADLQSIFDQASNEKGFSGRVFRDDVKAIVSDDPEYEFLSDYPPGEGFFRVFHCSPDYLLAMKAMAMRSALTSSDPTDFYHLSKACNVETLGDVKAIVKGYFPDDELDRPNELNIIDLLDYRDRVASGDEQYNEQAIRYIAG